LSIANARAAHVVITSFRKWKGPELRVLFIGVKFIEFSSKWPAGSKLEMGGTHVT
jgi:hypothetical protein